MKSINLTYSHKELQFHMFAAITFGLQHSIAKGYFITFESTQDSFVWKVFRSATAAENGDAEQLHSCSVSKGSFQMNDIRLGIMSKYIDEQAFKFLRQLPALIVRKNCLPQEEDSGLHFTNFHDMDDHPEVGYEGYSDDLLIDLDGWRRDFRIGYYDKDNGWQVYWHSLDDGEMQLDLKNGRWTYLPINKEKIEE